MGLFTNKDKIVNSYIYPYILLLVGVFAIIYLVVKMGTMGFVGGIVIAILPVILFGMYYFLKHPDKCYFIVFAANYVIMGIGRYVPALPGGILMDSLLLFILTALLIKTTYMDVGWDRAKNGLTISALIWLFYCIWELWNPEVASKSAWVAAIRGMAIYFLIIVILVPVLFKRYKDLKIIIIIWSVFTILAALKAYIQKNVGFDDAEWRWLMERGGGTHLLNTGTRYFSFFTDAANFGTGMGFSLVVFSIMSFFVKSKWLRFYFVLVSIAAFYGMIISGTRTALGVPFAGFALYVLISKNIKATVIITCIIIFMFAFLKFTYIGQGNPEIRRMRTAFDSKNASMNVRKENQKMIGIFMENKPFGVGVGLGGVKAKEFVPESYIAQIPTDSWFVVLWVETGVVGLTLYMMLMIYCILYGMYIVFFKIKDKELRAYLSVLVAGVTGMLVASSSNEVFTQFPNGIIIYTALAFIFMGVEFDKQIADEQKS